MQLEALHKEEFYLLSYGSLLSINIKTVVYADDVVILCSEQFTTMISERVGKTLKLLENWTNGCGLRVNPDITELVLFTRRKENYPLQNQ